MPRKKAIKLKEDYDEDVKRYLELVKDETLEKSIPPKRKQPRPPKQKATKRPKYGNPGHQQTNATADNTTTPNTPATSPEKSALVHNDKLACPATVTDQEPSTFEKHISQTSTYETMIAKIVDHIDDVDVGLHHCLVEKNLERERDLWAIPTTLYDPCALEPPQPISLGAELDEIDSFWDSIK